ncbi:MAG: ORF6N domain-containing protein [Bacteroidales bacterium]|nr:ORF6N domain-containing protein [Bacteroidales bacterium]
MIDRDLAELYGVETKRINEQVKRNSERFPPNFCFQLNEYERIELVANCDWFEKLKHSSSLPYAFTEQGVAMLSAVLKSETAVKVSIQIMQTFVEMRKFISNNALIFQRLDKLERAKIETDVKFEQIFKALENKDIKPDKGIFFDGQVFDAYTFVADLIRKAEKSIILIDNYVDDTILTLFSKRKTGIEFKIYTNKISRQLDLDIKEFNAQYEPVEAFELKLAHDRFLIIDNTELYHIGASLKDLGKKWFAFSKMDSEVLPLLSKIQEYS